jgi:hypothetical protein
MTSETNKHERKSMNRVAEILKSKKASSGYLWIQSLAGDCILWPSEEASVNDDGKNAIGRWQLTPSEEDALIATGEVDEVN